MGKVNQRNSGFLYWVLVPSLLLVASVFGVNFVSRPAHSNFQDICSVDSDCVNKSGCFTEVCSFGGCEAISFNSQTTNSTCFQCGVCGNGICEPGPGGVGEGFFDSVGGIGNSNFTIDCPQDCEIFAPTFSNDACADVQFGCRSINKDQCCAFGCQGSDSNGTSFDPDCCANTCGDGLIDQTNETCDGTVVKTGLTPPAGGNTCRAPGTTGECTYCGDGNVDAGAGEQCDPPNGTTCDSTCQTIVPPPVTPVCGNGILETGEACEGTTCSVTDTDGSIIPGICQNCQCLPQCEAEGSGCGDTGNTQAPCFSGTGGTTAGGSLIPPPVHPTVLAQWLAAFAVPGAVFTGLRMRRKKK